jgi:hypothetical protein
MLVRTEENRAAVKLTVTGHALHFAVSWSKRSRSVNSFAIVAASEGNGVLS